MYWPHVLFDFFPCRRVTAISWVPSVNAVRRVLSPCFCPIAVSLTRSRNHFARCAASFGAQDIWNITKTLRIDLELLSLIIIQFYPKNKTKQSHTETLNLGLKLLRYEIFVQHISFLSLHFYFFRIYSFLWTNYPTWEIIWWDANVSIYENDR